MANKRMIDKKISLSEKVADLDLLGKLLYTWMIPHADDIGLLQGSARTIKGAIFPLEDFTVEKVSKQLEVMVSSGLLQIVKVDGKKYYYIVDFEKNQTLKRDRQPQTLLPFEHEKEPKDSWKKLLRQFKELLGSQLEYTGNHLDTEEKRSKEKIREEKREEKPSAKISYLKTIPINDLEEFNKEFECSKYQIREKGLSLHDYCDANGRVYKNYKALLSNALRKDFGTRKPTQDNIPPVDENYIPIPKEKMDEFRKQRNLLATKKSLN